MPMKSMKEIENRSDKELAEFVSSERTELQKHRFAVSGGDVQAARAAKKHVARALTVLTARAKQTTK